MLQPSACSTTFRGGGLSAHTYVWPKQFIQEGVLGSGERLNRPESSNKRKGTCSRINSYFDPSVGSVWGSLMSICLAGISLAPGNPTGFLRIGEDSKVVRLELWRETHSEAAFRMSRGETPDGSGCLDICVCVCVCWTRVKFKGLLEGCTLYDSDKARHCDGCVRVHARAAEEGLGRVPLVWGTRSFDKVLFNSSEPKQSCFTHRDRQHIDKGQTVSREERGGAEFTSDSAQTGAHLDAVTNNRCRRHKTIHLWWNKNASCLNESTVLPPMTSFDFKEDFFLCLWVLLRVKSLTRTKKIKIITH